ncbi:hypothetical protein JHK85_036681 [Glycine max]|nr:hypothetical protein JHK85_036681 [Glycine max]
MDVVPPFYINTWINWLVNNLSNLQGILFAITCWTPWMSKNSLDFKREKGRAVSSKEGTTQIAETQQQRVGEYKERDGTH